MGLGFRTPFIYDHHKYIHLQTLLIYRFVTSVVCYFLLSSAYCFDSLFIDFVTFCASEKALNKIFSICAFPRSSFTRWNQSAYVIQSRFRFSWVNIIALKYKKIITYYSPKWNMFQWDEKHFRLDQTISASSELFFTLDNVSFRQRVVLQRKPTVGQCSV